jgi:hypothetical protein
MHALFVAIEQSGPSVFMREAPHAYFVALIFHAWGMGFLIGGGIVVCLRVIGVGQGAALGKFRGFYSVMWLGAAMAVISGLALLVAYPAKALTNPIFAIKLICLISAALLMRKLPEGSRRTAAMALALWLAVVAAGKLLLYTYSVQMVSG